MEKKNYPKVLVIAHNPFSDTKNNGKTLSSFFHGWPKDKLAQIFITGGNPDFSVCENFFYISEIDLLKSKVNKNMLVGDVIDQPNNISSYKKFTPRIKKSFAFNGHYFAMLLREMIWLNQPWNSRKLNEWINEYNPEIIFFQSSNGCFMFNMVKNICESRNIPLIMHTTDDYVTPKKTLNPFFWIQHLRLKSKYSETVSKAHCIFAIGETMAKEYAERFGGNFKVAMNSIKLSKSDPYIFHTGKVKLIYAGNLGLKRWKILSEIGKCLEQIQKEENIESELCVYSVDKPNEKVLKALTIEGIMSYKGSVTQKELLNIRNDADILIHVEAFDSKNKHTTRLSISTKIPEYLQSQRCILAVGPNDIDSIKYLRDNNLGIIVTESDRDQLRQSIRKILSEPDTRQYYAKKGIEFSKKNHNFDIVKSLVQQTIKEACIKNNITT